MNIVFEENGELVFKDDLINYDIYVLFYNKAPVYVGCSSDIEKRIQQHKSDKVFDSYCIYQSTYNKFEALVIERRVTYILSHLGNIDLINVSGTRKTKNIYKPQIIKV